MELKRTVVPKKLFKMFTNVITIILRKFLICVKIFGRCRSVPVPSPLVLLLLLLWFLIWWIMMQTSRTALPHRAMLYTKMEHSLDHYLKHVRVLIEPVAAPCLSSDEVPVIIMVASAPYHVPQRQAVRETWGRFQPTYFVLGKWLSDVDYIKIHNEANMFDDLIIFDFRDHYENLTLKTALMMKWTLERCSQAQFMFKTDDDVMVNPWTLSMVVKERANVPLIGYQFSFDCTHLKKEYIKNARWHHEHGMALSNYLRGTGYLIRGDYIEKILEKAYQVPIVNLEDVYYTNLVAHLGLGLTLTHDRRLSPYKPWLKKGCIYWRFASIHSVTAREMIAAWTQVERLIIIHTDKKGVDDYCHSYFYDIIKYFVLH